MHQCFLGAVLGVIWSGRGGVSRSSIGFDSFEVGIREEVKCGSCKRIRLFGGFSLSDITELLILDVHRIREDRVLHLRMKGECELEQDGFFDESPSDYAVRAQVPTKSTQRDREGDLDEEAAR